MIIHFLYLCKENKKNLLLLSNDKGIIIYEANTFDVNKIRFYKTFFITNKKGGYVEAYMFEKDKKNFLVEAILDSISGENLYTIFLGDNPYFFAF